MSYYIISKGFKRTIGPGLESSEIKVSFHGIFSKYKISTGFVALPNVIFNVSLETFQRTF